MIVIESKRKKAETILKKYPNAILADVTSSTTNEGLRKLSPFYPHGGIPVPFSEGYTASCVEAIWQGLKVFKEADVDTSLFSNSMMKGLKRTVRRFGEPLGHRKGVNGTELLGYIEARKVATIIDKMRKASDEGKIIVLLDYDTNADVENVKKPLSHASLIKAYVEGIYPYGNKPVERPKEKTKKVTKKKNSKNEGNNLQLELFNE